MIEPLKRRILEVLEHEGKALVALNTLLFAGDVHEAIVAHKVRITRGFGQPADLEFRAGQGDGRGAQPDAGRWTWPGAWRSTWG